MKVERLSIPDLVLIVPKRFGDERGHFSETYNAKRLREIGVDAPFVQDNQSLSRAKGTLRGLHCQVAPNVQGKLIRAVHGTIWDVAVDIRAGSPHFGKWAAATLTAEGGEQLWVPPGFLHGFVTILPDTEIFYKVTGEYDPAAERGVIWNDPALAIPWPLSGDPVLSEKDKTLPEFTAARDWFAAG
jgi:dTDP-4-dehydrorhamnose 3,5-epimerase